MTKLGYSKHVLTILNEFVYDAANWTEKYGAVVLVALNFLYIFVFRLLPNHPVSLLLLPH